MSINPATKFAYYRGHVIETYPVSEPITAAQLRTYLVESSDTLTDDEANEYIAEARNLIEEATGLALVEQSWKLVLDGWPVGHGEWWDGVREGSIAMLHGSRVAIDMPRYPLMTVDSVTTYDEAGTANAITVADTFDVDPYQNPGRLAIKSGATWPTALRTINAIEIVYTAGFAIIPPSLLRAVKQVAAYLYSHKGDDCSADDALGAAASLLSAYKVVRL